MCMASPDIEVTTLDNLARLDRKDVDFAPVIKALLRLDGPKACKVIEDRCDDFFIRTNSRRAIATMGKDYEVAIQPMLASDNRNVRELACDILSDIGTAASIPLIEAAVARIANAAEQRNFKRKADATIAKIKLRQPSPTP